jgi:hypothetical protein
MRLGFLLLFVLFISFFKLSAQTLPLSDDFLRRSLLKDTNDNKPSFIIRPIFLHANKEDYTDTSYASLNLQTTPKQYTLHKAVSFKILPITVKQQFNSHHPYSWNDGSMIPAKGHQWQVSMGFTAKAGPLNLQVQPEIVQATNTHFESIHSVQHDIVLQKYYPHVINVIDAPEKFGNGIYNKLLPGQSSLRLNHKKLSVGISTENLWWGPGTRNALLMTNNAPGFPHLTFNSLAPVKTAIGSFEWQLIGGYLKGSGFTPSDTFRYSRLYVDKPNDKRYINGVVATWQPKWVKGLYLGASRVSYLYKSDLSKDINGYLPVLGSFFKKNTINEDDKRRDQMIAVHFRLVLPGEKAEVYGEYGRNDHSADSRDLILEPEHSRAYVLGLRKLFDAGKTEIEAYAEFTNLQITRTNEVREQENWYSHYQVLHGYTHLGQYIGAGIGSGSASQTLGLNFVKNKKQTSFYLDRVVRNNDFYYNAIGPYWNFSSHWVDVSINVNKEWIFDRFLLKPQVSLIKSFNYQWMMKEDAFNLNAQLQASYFF